MAKYKKLSDGSYFVDYEDLNGVRHRVTVSTKTKAEELVTISNSHKLFDSTGIQSSLGERARNFRSLTYEALSQRYIDEHLKGTSSENNAGYVRISQRKWGSYKLPLLRCGEVRRWIKKYLKQKMPNRDGKLIQWQVSSVKKLARYMFRVFSWAMEEELIPENSNPFQNLINKDLKKAFKRINKRTRTLETDDFWQLMDDLPDEVKWMKRICIACWCAGLREGEVVNVKVRQVDMRNRLLRYQPTDTKETAEKTVGIEQELYEVLQKIFTEREVEALTNGRKLNSNDYVFLSVTGRKINQNFLARKFKKVLAELKEEYEEKGKEWRYDDLVIHDFRHCYTTRKRKEGHDKKVIKAQTGHKTESMFDWYNKVDEEEIQAMSGFTKQNLHALQSEVEWLVESARLKNIPLGAVQSLIGRLWRIGV